MGVLEAARAMSLRVPEDLAVVGFDDIEVAGALELTTVRQPLRDTGRRGAELLLASIEGVEPPAAQELAPLTLIERRTT
jgi:DNA-binding LacI/PurR family transcriptional regulator